MAVCRWSLYEGSEGIGTTCSESSRTRIPADHLAARNTRFPEKLLRLKSRYSPGGKNVWLCFRELALGLEALERFEPPGTTAPSS